METDGQKLTLEEIIMFIVLGVILLIAVGVLIIDGLSKKETNNNNETPTSEVETGKDEKEDDSKDLKEDTKDESNNNASNDNKEEKKKKKLPSTAVNSKTSTNEVLEWNFNREIVTECELGKTVRINKYVVLENGVMEEADVVVFKIVNNNLIRVDITNNEFVAEEGTYLYTYTYNNITKSIRLNVHSSLKETKKVTNSLDFNYVYFDYEVINNNFIEIINYVDNDNIASILSENKNNGVITYNKRVSKSTDVVP